MKESLLRESIGSREIAENVAHRARAQTCAYQKFLAAHQVRDSALFEDLPITDKATYLKTFAFEDLVGDDFADTFTIFGSSGSSGQPFYWPQIKGSHRSSVARFGHYIENAYGVHQRRTLVIVGLALGSWIGGDFFSWLLKNVAIAAPYPLAVFSPGNKHDEIIAMLHSAERFVDQFIVVCGPSAIGHLILRAKEKAQPLPLGKIHYLVLGEPFPEVVREDLERNSLAEGPRMFSVYGSADTGLLGFESPASIILRRICMADPLVAEDLQLGPLIPHFFHHADPDTYLETVGGELCITKWQGIPLVRYNLHDSARLYDWQEIARLLPSWVKRNPALAPSMTHLERCVAFASLSDSGILAITGRSDSCLILCGTNLTETMLDEAVRSSECSGILTGLYRAHVLMEKGRQRLGMTVEYRPEHGTPDDAAEIVYPRLICALGRAQPEFKDDWASIYQWWDTDPEKRILKLNLVPWPEMSRSLEHEIKARGVRQ
jgi:phenylacetate-CoA ligase